VGRSPLEFDKFPEVQIDIPARLATTLAIAGIRTPSFAGAGIPGDSVKVETLEVFITAQPLFRRTVWIFLTDHDSSPPHFSFSWKNGKAAFKRALLHRGGKVAGKRRS
jgi:hypothetical protein